MNYKELYAKIVAASQQQQAVIVHPEIISWVSGGNLHVNYVAGEALKADVLAAMKEGANTVRQPRSLGENAGTETRWLKSIIGEKPEFREFTSLRRNLLPFHEGASRAAAAATLSKAQALLQERIKALKAE